MSRAGSTLFWRVHGEVVDRKLGKRRVIPMLALLLASPALALAAEPLLQLCAGVAGQLADPTIYIRAVLGGAS
jgi:multicomponent K+:H+ antiporter subunit D